MAKQAPQSSLSGRVAVVTGASRGAGRYIARELGRRGATVYVTGRSTRARGTTENLPGTIDDTADEVTAAGGRGVAVRVDHTDDAQIRGLFEQVRGEQRRLDVLINNAWGGYEQYDGAAFDAPFWEQPIDKRWNGMYIAGLRPMFVACQAAAPLLLEKRDTPRLIVNTVGWAHDAYLGNLLYDTVKAAIIRMSFGLGHELRDRNVAAVALAPGFMRTERVMHEHAKAPFDLGGTESPVYIARAAAALASDPAVMAHTGKLVTAGDLARVYGFTDEDGRQPASFRIPES